jgi:hypothetical protein
MPLRFYRRFRAGPFRMNVSKRGVSWSVGTKGAWLTASPRHIRRTVGIPGTGLYWYREHRLPRRSSTPSLAPILPPPTKLQWFAIAAIVVILIGTALFVTAVSWRAEADPG